MNNNNNNILLCGSTGGLGFFLLKYFIDKNFNVISLNRKELSINSKNHQQYICDLLNEKKLISTLKKIKIKFKTLSLYINCSADLGKISHPFNTNYKSWIGVFKVNIFSQTIIVDTVLKMMKKNTTGSIIFFSGGGATTYPTGIRKNLNEYSCSKIALIKFSENLASSLDTKKYLININVIAPGLMPTNLSKKILNKGKKYLNNEIKIIEKSLKLKNKNIVFETVLDMIKFLFKNKSINGKILSSTWDKVSVLEKKTNKITKNKNIFTMRRIIK